MEKKNQAQLSEGGIDYVLDIINEPMVLSYAMGTGRAIACLCRKTSDAADDTIR